MSRRISSHHPRQPALGRVFLPFEGDTTLSIIIGKALLLADDRSITEPVIVSQIRGRS
jgi:hypothetical protein